MSKWKLKACPRCKTGDLYFDYEYVTDIQPKWMCITCGWRDYDTIIEQPKSERLPRGRWIGNDGVDYNE